MSCSGSSVTYFASPSVMKAANARLSNASAYHEARHACGTAAICWKREDSCLSMPRSERVALCDSFAGRPFSRSPRSAISRSSSPHLRSA